MASTPTFGSTPRFGSVQLTNADGTGVVDVANFVPVSAGTRVKEIRVFSGATAPGGTHRCVIAVHDGTNVRILESFQLINSTYQLQSVFRYDSFKLPFGHKLQVQDTVGLAASATLDFLVFGEDLT